MKLKFKQQDYQLDATSAIVDIFQGQEKSNGIKSNIYSRIGYLDDLNVVSNPPILLNEDELSNNIFKIQEINNIPSSKFSDFKNFTIEMETGTGKTYTYINTMYELNIKYGFSKFIIVVPSVAIREGVFKSLEVTSDHFQEIYKKKIRYAIYDSANPQKIMDFTDTSEISCLIMNYQAFNTRSKDARKIFQERDEFGSRAPIDLIKATRPIMIIDEPQKISDKTQKTIDDNFNTLFHLRYSATHKKGYEFNKMYSLNAVDAYNQKLVKKIEVIGLELVNDKSEGTYIYVYQITPNKKGPSAMLEIEKHTASGVKKHYKKFYVGDDLFIHSNEMQPYKGFVISEINAHPDNMWVSFTNGIVLNLNDMIGEADNLHIFRAQIKETVKAHIEKEKMLYAKGIKVLSLFFIDKVVNYRDYENEDAKGILARMFEEVYQEVISEIPPGSKYYEYIKQFSNDAVHSGYFSIDKKTKKNIDSNEGKDQNGSDDKDAYDLILKDKERLLSFREPTRFIFSHSALREGWDNPNVFQICTLKESSSEINKRQEIGRGLRICVNQHGERMDVNKLETEFHLYNTLTVVASESYDSFCDDLQKEMADSLAEKRIIFKKEVLQHNVIYNELGHQMTINPDISNKIHETFKSAGYLDYATNEVTETFRKALAKKDLKLPEELKGFEKDVLELLNKNIFENHYTIDNGALKNIKPEDFILNKNFEKEEFQKLWRKICHKSTYSVNFDSDVLVEKSIQRANNIRVTRIEVKKTFGGQKDQITDKMVKLNDSVTNHKVEYSKINEFSHSTIKYDLIGEIKKHTNLMRKTIINVLKGMEEEAFNEYKFNPESFIKQLSDILNDEKATLVISGIKYYKTDKIYENDIFIDNRLSGQLEKDVFKVENHIYDYVKVDSKIEENFAKDLERDDRIIYAKLPFGFKIPTPIGNYNPDWALVINDDIQKRVYFIAETKGTNEVSKLRQSEQSKIACAREHFLAISDGEVKYDVVDTYEQLKKLIEF